MNLIFGPDDECPACHTKSVDAIKIRNGMVLQAMCGAFICVCGCHYMPLAMLNVAEERAKSPIILPGQSG